MTDSVRAVRDDAPQRARHASRAAFISNELFRTEHFGSHHPLSIPRQSAVLDVCFSLGWLNPEQVVACTAANEETLTRFHDPGYVHALQRACVEQKVSRESRERFHIGTMENPVFAGLYERASTVVGGSINAARLALDGGIAFHPAGGTHHGRPDRAAGFCYLNDPVFAIYTLLDEGLRRVAYIDLDAHHGDGVQDAFASDARVMTVSIHEESRWPGTGKLEDRGGGQARNLPVPSGFNDSEMAYLIEQALVPLLDNFEPEALVITCGADPLMADPLSGMALSNQALWDAVITLSNLSERNVILGGGGYNPWTVVRCWAGLWGKLTDQALPDRLPEEVIGLLKTFECDLVDDEEIQPGWFETLQDPYRWGPLRPEIARLAEIVLQ